MSKKLLFKGGHATGMIPYEIEDFSTLYMVDARIDEKTKAYIDSVIGNSVLNLCPYRNVLVTHKYDTVEGNIVTLDDCEDDEIIQLSEIQGNTMVNCNKDTDKELILMPNLDTNGYSNITLTQGIDGGKVDVSLEGNTMVNVCDQEDPVAITKSYTVETGNHVALQGEYDGKCRPNIYGNTLVNLRTNNNCEMSISDKSLYTQTYKSNTRIAGTVASAPAWVYVDMGRINMSLFKPNTKYTIIFNNATKIKQVKLQRGDVKQVYSNEGKIVNNKAVLTTISNLNEFKFTYADCIYCYLDMSSYPISFDCEIIGILEGDYTNKPIPDYFTGMKSSFEDKLVPENLYKFSSRDDFYSLDGGTTLDGQYIKMTANSGYQNAMLKPLATIKPSTTYTIVVDVVENTLNSKLVITAPVKEKDVQLFTTQTFQIDAGKTGIFTQMATTSNDLSGCVRCLVNYLQNTNTTGSIKYRVMVVEGDYTKYDFTDYDSTKAGKYKVDYKVTGKNKLSIKETPFLNSGEISLLSWNSNSISATTSSTNSWQYIRVPLENLQPNTDYILNYDVSVNRYARVYKGDNSIDSRVDNNVVMRKFNSGDCENLYIRFFITTDDGETGNVTYSNIQLEEGTTATDYEPYKESIKTLYLNSPLLEGDTIEQSGNNIIHNHRYKEVILDGSDDERWYENTQWTNDDCITRAFYVPQGRLSPKKANGEKNILCDRFIINAKMGIQETESVFGEAGTGAVYIRIKKDKLSTQDLAGFKQYLQQNPITVVYELAQPTQEIISTNDNLLLDSYANGHLDVDSVIPIDKVVFQGNFNKSLRYLYPNTEYIIQFESNNSGKIDKLHLAGTNSDIFNVVKGVNKYTLTTGELSSKSIVINGIGFNMSKVVVTPKVDGDFGYFKGMKSVGQNDVDGHKIEILSQNKNLLDNLIPYPITVAKNDSKHNDGALLGIVKVKPNTTYIMSATRDKKSGRIVVKMSNRIILSTELQNELFTQDYIYNFLKQNYANGRSFEKTLYSQDYITFTTLSDCNYLYVNVDSKYNMDNDVTEVTISNVQIEEVKDTSTSPTTSTPHKHNKKEILLSEPLRGLPNGVKDKYVIIDGKWYIERNCGYSNVIIDKKSVGNDGLSYRYSYIHNGNSASISSSIASKTMFVDNMYGAKNVAVADYSSTKDKNTLYFHFANMDNVPSYAQDLASFREFIDGKVINIVFLLNTPTYEPIDYNPFEVYTDTTHISNNSNIPCNMVIRNSGFNCILKPNTTYTVSSNNGLSSVTTKASIGDGILRFYDKDTTSVTKMSKVLVLEGDYITGNPPIPAFFKGMESVFEQELVTDENDEHYGKYKVTVKAVGKNLFGGTWVYNKSNNKINSNDFIKVKPNTTYTIADNLNYRYQIFEYADKNTHIRGIYPPAGSYTFTIGTNTHYLRFSTYPPTTDINVKFQLEEGTKATEYEPYKENNITFYINEPLRGVGNVKDKVYVKEDKVVVERNCVSYVLDSNKIPDLTSCGNKLYMCNISVNNSMVNTGYGEVVCNSFPCDIYNAHRRNYANTISTVVDASVPNGVIRIITDKDTKTLKQWLQQNPTTVVYQLAQPTYEEVECDLSKLALEGYDHGTLFYNSNIPVTTQFYDFKVNIKDMLIPNETYYITFIADRVKDIAINLSGVQVNYKTSMGYNKVPVQLGDIVNTNFSMDSRGVELSDLMISTSTSLIYVKDMNDVCVYDKATNKYSITITSTNGKESDKRVILLDYPLLRLNKDIYDRLYYSNKDSRYRIDKKVFKHKFTNEHEYSKYAAETNDTYYSSFISLNETIKDYVVITNEKVKTVKVEDDKYYFKIKWSDLGVSDKTEANGNQGVKDFFNNNEVYLYYATDGFVEIVDGLRRQTLKVYQPETFMKFSGNTTTTVTILIPMKNV